MRKAILNTLKTLATEKGVADFIKKRKELCIRPCYKTVRAYIAGEYEAENLSPQNIADIVKAELMGMEET